MLVGGTSVRPLERRKDKLLKISGPSSEIHCDYDDDEDDDDDDEFVVTLFPVWFCVIQVWCENVNVPKRTIAASTKSR